MIKIALDAMGGDSGLGTTLPGISHFSKTYKADDVEFVIFGNGISINEYFLQNKCACKFSVIDTGANVISSEENPIHAIKTCHNTSMYQAVKYVADGDADAVVSAGNTGAYMVLSKILIGTIDGVLRPALVNIIPTKKGKTIMLDLGANTDCTPDKLHQFAIMGKATAKILLNITNPTIGLLNIGTEKMKGTEVLSHTYDLILKDKNINFNGFIEGNNITDGSVDVVVTDGFTGNIALKSIEGAVKLVASLIKDEIKLNLLSKVNYFLGGKGILSNLRKKLSPSLYNGAPFVGLNKVVVKSHGGSDYIGFAHAIHTATELIRSGFVKNIKKSLGEISE